MGQFRVNDYLRDGYTLVVRKTFCLFLTQIFIYCKPLQNVEIICHPEITKKFHPTNDLLP